MSKIPVTPISTVEQRGIPTTSSGPQKSAADFGAIRAGELDRIGAGLQQVGGTVYDISEQLQVEKNRAKVRDLSTQYQNEMTAFREGQRRKIGEAGLGDVKETQDFLESLRERYSKQLDNPAQKDLFSRVSVNLERQGMSDAIRNQFAQLDRYNQDTVAAANGSDENAMVANRNDAQFIASKMSAIKARTAGLPQLRGRDETVVANALKKVTTNAHMQVANAKLRGTGPGDGATAAMKYVEANSGEIEAVVSEKFMSEAKEEALRQDVSDLADSLALKHPGNLKAQMAEADTLVDVKERDALKSRLLQNDRVTRLVNARAEEARTSEILKGIYADPMGYKIPADYPPEKRASLEAVQKRLQTSSFKEDHTAVFKLNRALANTNFHDSEEVIGFYKFLDTDEMVNGLSEDRRNEAKKLAESRQKASNLTNIDRMTKDVTDSISRVYDMQYAASVGRLKGSSRSAKIAERDGKKNAAIDTYRKMVDNLRAEKGVKGFSVTEEDLQKIKSAVMAPLVHPTLGVIRVGELGPTVVAPSAGEDPLIYVSQFPVPEDHLQENLWQVLSTKEALKERYTAETFEGHVWVQEAQAWIDPAKGAEQPVLDRGLQILSGKEKQARLWLLQERDRLNRTPLIKQDSSLPFTSIF